MWRNNLSGDVIACQRIDLTYYVAYHARDDVMK